MVYQRCSFSFINVGSVFHCRRVFFLYLFLVSSKLSFQGISVKTCSYLMPLWLLYQSTLFSMCMPQCWYFGFLFTSADKSKTCRPVAHWGGLRF